MRWIGHLFRMSEDTPARIALEEAEREVKKPRGKQKNTWIKTAKIQLKEDHNIEWTKAKVIAQDRDRWKEICRK